jgi:hypothetical protein
LWDRWRERLQAEGEDKMNHLLRTSLRATIPVLAVLAMIAVTMTLAVAAPGALPGLQEESSPAVPARSVLYIYRYDTAKAGEFEGLLEAGGLFSVTTTGIGAIPTDVRVFDLFIVADDTGSLDAWGSPPAASDVISRLVAAQRPIIGLGEGGYAFFGKISSPIGWPHGWHGPQTSIYVSETLGTYFSSPNPLAAVFPGTSPLYVAPVNEVGIYKLAVPASTQLIGWEPRVVNQKPDPDHAPLGIDGCYHLWGFSDGPSTMNEVGKELFVNAATYMSVFQCPVPPTTKPPCLEIVKSSVPPSGSSVAPGGSITYTLTYTVGASQCAGFQQSLLVDQVPANTLFVPGSAGAGKTPNFEGALVWDLGFLTPTSSGSKTFKTSVLDTVCNGPQFITNTAQMRTPLGTYDSNVTSHKVTCPPIALPNQEPPYAEREIQVYPYPLVKGTATKLSVLVDNNSSASQTLTVTFQTSPSQFGIGLDFIDLPVTGNPRVVTLPPHSTIELQVNWRPDVSGITCIQVKIEGAGFAPIYTLRNLDVTEDLKAGMPDILTFKVGNPTAASANITLVVDNTCPGWTATVSPTVLVGVGPNPTDFRTAELSVTPPSPAILGTGCHIDVQGWIGAKLIGGIRKLDVPPVHLTPSNPPWLEQEISTIPAVPVSGTVNQACVELQNPLAVSRVVTVTFSEADFGAGVGFTPFTTQVFTLPPNTIARYCVAWTPLPGGTRHRCLLVTLRQPGFLDQRSQLNVDIAPLPPGAPPVGWAVPFWVGNPLAYTSTITLGGKLIGLSGWTPAFTPALPLVLGPGARRLFTVTLAPALMAQGASAVAAGPGTFGDVVRLDVTLSLDGEPFGGLSIDLAPLRVFLPLVLRSN